MQSGSEIATAPTTIFLPGPGLTIVDEQSITPSPVVVVLSESAVGAEAKSPLESNSEEAAEKRVDDEFANSLGAVAQILSSKRTETWAPSVFPESQGTDDDVALADNLPEPPKPEAEDEDDQDDAGGNNNSVDLTTLSASSSGPVFTAAKSLHTCKYGKSEKTGALSMSTWIWRFKKSAIGHDEYMKTPGSSRIAKIKSAMKMALQDDWKHAPGAAALAGYTLCKVDFGSHIVVAWQPRMRGDALVFTRHGYAISPVILEVPHPQFDHTLVQGLQVFRETKARALILSSSHRCSKALANKCTGNDGETIKSNCASRTSYHNSDAAHSTQTTFMAVHEELASVLAQDLFVSLHSTKLDEFVVSDGTSNTAKSESARVVILANEIALALPDIKVGLCNEFSQISSGPANLLPVPEEASFVCGATNVQGRHLNGAEDPCRAKVSRSGVELVPSGRFIHIEQPVGLVKPESTKSVRPPMSRPLSEAILKSLAA